LTISDGYNHMMAMLLATHDKDLGLQLNDVIELKGYQK
jgi:hypothetical protein